MSKTEDDRENPLVKKALLELRRMRTQLESEQRMRSEPIAIVGTACRFAGGVESAEAFFELLRNGVDTIREIPRERWDVDEFYDPDPDAKGKMYVRHGGFLDQVDLFDPDFFGISGREAVTLDPQQRLLLEMAWEALENAGIAATTLRGGRTGVFFSAMNTDYMQVTHDADAVDVHTSTGTMSAVAAGRLAYVLGLQGPAMTVDTACSSALVAVHLACHSLRRRECDLVVAGGINLMLAPHMMVIECTTRMLAPDGRCKTFDAAANGFGRGEGGGLVVLKRLSDAQADGDNIIAVIRGSAVNHDGRSSGLSVPNGLAQEVVIREALKDAGVEPAAIDYVETHGTGTNLGDPIEVGALHGVFGRGRNADRPLWVGSVKTNLGHLEWAAGIAGLMKAALALQHKEIPPHIHLKTLNPLIAWDEMSLKVPMRPQPWPTHDGRCMAGVSSFGLSGTNSHVILEEAPPAPREPVTPRGAELLVLSGKTDAALTDQVKRYRTHLEQHPDLTLEDVCFTAATGRSHFAHRLSVVACDRADLARQLATLESNGFVAGSAHAAVEDGTRPKTAFLFTGQGSQYAGMARELYDREPVFRTVLDRCQAGLPDLQRPLLEVLFGPDDGTLNETGYTQPALYALETGLAALWVSWGIQPDVVMGHSVGEYAAAQIAGVFSLEDGLKLIAARARFMQALPAGGAMAAVMASAERIQPLLQGHATQVSLAAINGPESVVISGVAAVVEELCQTIEVQQIKTHRLAVSHAFHSPLMEPMLGVFRKIAEGISYRPPTLPLVSNVTGDLADDAVASADYWVKHVSAPVQFAAGMQTLQRAGVSACIEIGPKPVLLGMARACVPEESMGWFASLHPGQPDVRALLESLGGLYVRGAPVDWRGVYAARGYRKAVLPTYPFQRRRYWPNAPASVQKSPGEPARSAITDLLDQGDANGLADFIRTRKACDAAEQATLPSIARLLVEQHQQDRKIEVVNDWLYEIDWREKPEGGDSSDVSETGYWLVLSNSKRGEELAGILASSRQRCLMARHGQSYASSSTEAWCVDPEKIENFERLLDEGGAHTQMPLMGVVHLWPAETAIADLSGQDAFRQAHRIGTGSLLHLVQALNRKRIVPGCGVWSVGRGMFPASGEMEASGIFNASLAGLALTVALEHDELWGGMVDLAPATDVDEMKRLFAHMINPRGEARVAFRHGKCLVPRLVRRKFGDIRFVSPAPDGCYLVTGGTGALGMCVAQWLVNRGARRLVLVARSAMSAQSQDAVKHMQGCGANVVVEQADVTDRSSMEAVIKNIESSGYPLRGVIHAAGFLDNAVLQELDWERFGRVMAPKVVGGWNLHELTRGMALDFFVLFSSAASVFGAAGQGNYAAGNAFLDALAAYRRSQGLPGIAINWGPWADVGMAAQLDKVNQKRMASRGVGTIDPALGLMVLEHLIAGHAAGLGAPQQLALPVQWKELSRMFPGVAGSSFLSEIPEFEQARTESDGKSSETVAQLLNSAPAQRAESILAYLKNLTATTLMMDAGQVSGDSDLTEIGVDSLMVMEMLESIKRDLKLMVYPREVYANPRLADLAHYLATELDDASEDTAAKTDGATTPVGQAGLPITGITDPRAGLPPDFSALDPVVFLLSTPRSGSTLLRVMLAGHPALFSPPELHLLPFETMVRRHEGLKDSYLEQGLQRALMEIKGLDADAALALLDEYIQRDAPIYEVYASLQESVHPRLVVDKSPTYALNPRVLERAEAMFARPKYIHLVRHPVSSVESFVRMRMEKLMGSGATDPQTLAEQVWANGNRNIDRFLRGLGEDRVHRVQFEDLVAEPEKALRSICSFLGVEYDPAMADPYRGERMTDGVRANSRPIGDPNFAEHRRVEIVKAEAWKTIQLPHLLGQETMQLAESFGYRLSHEDEAASSALTEVIDVPMSEQFVEARGLQFCLCCWGEAGAPLIVLLHGILDQGAAWEQVAVRLAREGYWVIAPDLRGHGRSSRVGVGGSYSLLDFVADLDVILARFADNRFTLVGHSLGTILAAMYAGTHSERVASLVLVETVLPANTGNNAGWNQIKTQLKYLAGPPAHPVFNSVDAAAEKLRQMTPSLSVEFSRRLAARITQACGEGVCWTWDPLLGTRAGISGGVATDKAGYLQLLGQISVPTALLFGDSSRLNRPADIAGIRSAMARARHYMIAGGHQLHIDAYGKVAEHIIQAARLPEDMPEVNPILETQE